MAFRPSAASSNVRWNQKERRLLIRCHSGASRRRLTRFLFDFVVWPVDCIVNVSRLFVIQVWWPANRRRIGTRLVPRPNQVTGHRPCRQPAPPSTSVWPRRSRGPNPSDTNPHRTPSSSVGIDLFHFRIWDKDDPVDRFGNSRHLENS